MNNTNNQGVIVAGNGSLTAHNIVAGDHAHAESVHIGHGTDAGPTLGHLQKEMDALLAQFRKETGRIPPEAIKAVETVTAEVKKPAPDKLTVTCVLDSVAKLVTSVGGLSGSIAAAKDLAAFVLK